MFTLIAFGIAIFLIGLVIGFAVGHYIGISDAKEAIESVQTQLDCTKAELLSLQLKSKMQSKKYDDVYSQLLKVNEVNAKLTKEKMLSEDHVHHFMPRNYCKQQEMDEKAKADLLKKDFSKEMGAEVYQLYLRGASRKSLAKRFGVSYPHICAIIRGFERRQDPLF